MSRLKFESQSNYDAIIYDTVFHVLQFYFRMGGFVSESESDDESDSSLLAVKEPSSEENRLKAVEEHINLHKRKEENWENEKKKYFDDIGEENIDKISKKELEQFKRNMDRKFDKKAEEERKAREGEHFKKLGISDAILNGALDQTIEDDLDGSENLDRTMATGYIPDSPSPAKAKQDLRRRVQNKEFKNSQERADIKSYASSQDNKQDMVKTETPTNKSKRNSLSYQNGTKLYKNKSEAINSSKTKRYISRLEHRKIEFAINEQFEIEEKYEYEEDKVSKTNGKVIQSLDYRMRQFLSDPKTFDSTKNTSAITEFDKVMIMMSCYTSEETVMSRHTSGARDLSDKLRLFWQKFTKSNEIKNINTGDNWARRILLLYQIVEEGKCALIHHKSVDCEDHRSQPRKKVKCDENLNSPVFGYALELLLMQKVLEEIHIAFLNKYIIPKTHGFKTHLKKSVLVGRIDVSPDIKVFKLSNLVNIIEGTFIDEVIEWSKQYRGVVKENGRNSEPAKNALIVDIRIGNIIEMISNCMIRMVFCLNVCLYDKYIHVNHLWTIKPAILEQRINKLAIFYPKIRQHFESFLMESHDYRKKLCTQLLEHEQRFKLSVDLLKEAHGVDKLK